MAQSESSRILTAEKTAKMILSLMPLGYSILEFKHEAGDIHIQAVPDVLDVRFKNYRMFISSSRYSWEHFRLHFWSDLENIDEFHVWLSYEELVERLTGLLSKLDDDTLKELHGKIAGFAEGTLRTHVAVNYGLLNSGVKLSPELQSKLSRFMNEFRRAGVEISVDDETARAVMELVNAMKDTTLLMSNHGIEKYTVEMPNYKCETKYSLLSGKFNVYCYSYPTELVVDASIRVSGGEAVLDNITIKYDQLNLQRPALVAAVTEFKKALNELVSVDAVADENAKKEIARMLLTLGDITKISRIDAFLMRDVYDTHLTTTLIISNDGHSIIIDYGNGSRISFNVSWPRSNYDIYIRTSFTYNEKGKTEIHSLLNNEAVRFVINKIASEFGSSTLRGMSDILRRALNRFLAVHYAFYSGLLASGVPLTSGFQAGTLETLGYITRLHEALFNKPIELTEDDVKVLEHTRRIIEHVHDITQKMVNRGTRIYNSYNITIYNEVSRDRLPEIHIEHYAEHLDLEIYAVYNIEPAGSISIHDISLKRLRFSPSMIKLFSKPTELLEYIERVLRETSRKL